jgi:hypothetical protein
LSKVLAAKTFKRPHTPTAGKALERLANQGRASPAEWGLCCGGAGCSGVRRITQDRIEESALELLHAIREHHPDIYAGAWVNPYTAALEAGLDPDSSPYRVAMEYLQAEDVLELAEESRELEGSPLYTITLRGMEMLREV